MTVDRRWATSFGCQPDTGTGTDGEGAERVTTGRAVLGGRRRIQISILPAVAKLLSVSLEGLLAEETGHTRRKRGPTSRLEQQIEIISQLPKIKQKFVTEMLDNAIGKTE